jgi:hypothetical protein
MEFHPDPQYSHLHTTLLQKYPISDVSTINQDELVHWRGKVYIYQSTWVLKFRASIYEMNMMHLVGSCALPICGQLINQGRHFGYVTRLEGYPGGPIDTVQWTPAQKQGLTTMMVQLLRRFHWTCLMIHGNVNRSNLVLCRDMNLRLCGFMGAFLREYPPTRIGPMETMQYLSPYRFAHMNEPLMTEDDRYALAVCIWELFTEKGPGTYGEMVDVREVRDVGVRNLIKDLMVGMLSQS